MPHCPITVSLHSGTVPLQCIYILHSDTVPLQCIYIVTLSLYSVFTLTAGHPGLGRGNRCALWTAWVVNLLGQRNDAWWAVPSPPLPPRDHSPPPLLRNRSAFLHPPPSARQGWTSAGEKTRWTIGSKKKIKFFIMTKRKKDDFENRRKNWIRFLY